MKRSAGRYDVRAPRGHSRARRPHRWRRGDPQLAPAHRDLKSGGGGQGGIEPPTRGFSVRRSARPGARKPKTRNKFLAGRPNRSARPSPCRTGMLRARAAGRCAHARQRLVRVRTERFLNSPRPVTVCVNAPWHVCFRPKADIRDFYLRCSSVRLCYCTSNAPMSVPSPPVALAVDLSTLRRKVPPR